VAWALVGAQGRYRLATYVAFVCSWVITTPLAALSVFLFEFDLKGVTAAVVVGYSLTGTCLTYVLLRSDWVRLAEHIVETNRLEDEEIEKERLDRGNGNLD